MHPNELDTALMAIDTRNWRTAAVKLRIVTCVKLNTLCNRDERDGVPLPGRYIAKAIGLGISRANIVLAELVDEGVLIRVLEGAGRRGAVYSIQPELRAWRVPWAVPIADVELRAALVSGRLVAAKPPVARAAWGRAQALDARAAWERAQDPGCARGQAARANGTVARAAWGRAQPLDDSRVTPIPLVEDLSTEQQQPTEACNEDVEALARAIWRRTQRGCSASLRAKLAGVLSVVDDVDAIIRWIDTYADDRHGPPIIVDTLVTIAPEFAAQAAPTGPRSWSADPGCDRCGGSGWDYDDPAGARPCPCRTTPEEASTCQNQEP